MAEKVKLTGAKNGAGPVAEAKAVSIVGRMAAEADSIDDLDVLRHGGLARLFGELRAPVGAVRFPRCARGAMAEHRNYLGYSTVPLSDAPSPQPKRRG
ncbi:hypothetical protein [Streptomyces sp. NPDC088789]|uniref:hypothetical protein n=1 Tax=Streptomyces sp. NPDC088789 TaxID=3365899 RepID=UPI0037F1CBC9